MMQQPKNKVVFVIGIAIALFLISFSGCTALLGDFDVATGDDSGTGDTGAGKAEGVTCAAGTECGSGNCVDGVCCESACNGTCETCNLPGSPGKCMPVPDGEDPQNECPTTPLPDAGVEDASIVFEDAGDDGAVSDGGVVEAGTTFEVPDSGVTTEDNQCAGKCNGKRACNYPGSERTCGSIVCGNRRQQGRAACDGEGHCLFGIEDCQAFSCPDGSNGCVKTCTKESDCLKTHFCDAATSACKPKLGEGSACASVAQCQSGFCVDGVCCNSECNGFPGATCKKPGSVGSCQCDACSTGACQLWYRDEDGDGYGDKYGTIQNGRATPGCVVGAAPAAGFVKNKDDCYDGPGNTALAAQVHPGQTGFYPSGAFTSYIAPGQPESYDFDCDGNEVKETPEYLNGTCGFCNYRAFPVGCSRPTTCSTNGESAGLACGTSICKKGEICARCTTLTTTGFTTTVDCGESATATNCGYCSNGALIGTTTPTVKQRCH